MIHIQVTREDQTVTQIEMTGHANYADHGYDIVCAAVSSQIISVENSLDHLLKVPMDLDVDENNGGYLNLRISKTNNQMINEQAQLLLRHLVLALEVIAESYSKFVKIQITD